MYNGEFLFTDFHGRYIGWQYIPADAMPGFYLQLVKYHALENRGSSPDKTDFFQRIQL
jgi:hypothetical protein